MVVLMVESDVGVIRGLHGAGYEFRRDPLGSVGQMRRPQRCAVNVANKPENCIAVCNAVNVRSSVACRGCGDVATAWPVYAVWVTTYSER